MYTHTHTPLTCAHSINGISLPGGFIVAGVICNNLFLLVFTSQADSGGCGSAAQPHQALTDETRVAPRQGALEM